MPISTSIPIRRLDQESFHQIDKRVRGLAFEIQNEFGRYFDEKVYQHELTQRCRGIGLEVQPEMKITVSKADYKKDYFVDLLINRGVVVETKAVEELNAAHKGQTLNYLFLCGLQHATMLNFRPTRVQHEFVSTSFHTEDRFRFELITHCWKPLTLACQQLQKILTHLLDDWGAYLDTLLYREAITHFFGGSESVEKEIPIYSCGKEIGTQKVRLIEENIAFSITSSIHHPDSILHHQRRFLHHTPLRAIQWINLNRDQIELHTIQKT